jgi:CBS domain-containing protein
MTTVAQLLDAKGHEVWTIAPDASVYAAIQLRADKQVGALPVVDAQQVVGIVSERDYARKAILQDLSPQTTPVRAIMTDQVLYVRPDQSIDDCMALMTAKRVRHLPVLAADQLQGIVSIGDVVKALLADREVRIEQLEQYITGRR